MINELMKDKIVFISGKISGDDKFEEKFAQAELKLRSYGCKVLNPAKLPQDLPYEKQMDICFKFIDVSDYVYFLQDSIKSKGSTREKHYCESKNKICLYDCGENKYLRTHEGRITMIE